MPTTYTRLKQRLRDIRRPTLTIKDSLPVLLLRYVWECFRKSR